MNLPFRSDAKPEAVLLTVDDFELLKRAGAFSRYQRSELLMGELWGVPKQTDDEPESDASFPIKLRTEDYLRLDAAGAFAQYGKTELVDGVVYRMSPQCRPHGFVKDELAYRLRRRLEEIGSPLRVATEQTVDMSPHSQPQPDIILTTEPRGEGAIPVASVALIVEVSGATLSFDLGEKADLYAKAGVPEYWVVDLNENRVLCHAHPRPNDWGYDGQLDAEFGTMLYSATVEGLAVESKGLE